MSDLPNNQRDVRWLIKNCELEGVAKPDSATMEAFAERVAVKMADGSSEFLARREAFSEWREAHA